LLLESRMARATIIVRKGGISYYKRGDDRGSLFKEPRMTGVAAIGVQDGRSYYHT
jgi:hypothetical protein